MVTPLWPFNYEDTHEDNKLCIYSLVLRLERAAQLDPASHKPLLKTGKLHQKRGDYVKAKAFFLRALELSPSSAQVLYNLGKLHVAQGLYKSAVEVLERVLELLPSSKVGAAILVEAYRGAGEREKAEEIERVYELESSEKEEGGGGGEGEGGGSSGKVSLQDSREANSSTGQTKGRSEG